MLSLIILALLFLGFLIGLKRGFVMQVFHLINYIISFIIAVIYYDKLSEKLALWIPYPELSSDTSWALFLQTLPLENAFYNAVSFAIIFFTVKIILHIIASMLDFIAEMPILRSVNKLFGAGLGFLEMYLILFILLFILALTPLSSIQDWIEHSFVAKLMIEYTPIFSKLIKSLWI